MNLQLRESSFHVIEECLDFFMNVSAFLMLLRFVIWLQWQILLQTQSCLAFFASRTLSAWFDLK